MAKAKKEIYEDEISLVELLKIIWKWRFFSITFLIIFLIFAVLYKIKTPVKYKSYTLIVHAEPISVKIEDYLFSTKIVNDALKILGEKEFYNLLEIEKNKNLNVSEVVSKMRKLIKINGNRIEVQNLKNTENLIKFNNLITELLVQYENKFLEEDLIEMAKILKKNSLNNMFVLPFFKKAKIIKKADENSIERISPNKNMIAIIFLGIFISLIPPFILEWFKSIDFSEFKKL